MVKFCNLTGLRNLTNVPKKFLNSMSIDLIYKNHFTFFQQSRVFETAFLNYHLLNITKSFVLFIYRNEVCFVIIKIFYSNIFRSDALNFHIGHLRTFK